MSAGEHESIGLSQDDVEQYHEKGYVGPYRLVDEAGVVDLAGRIKQQVAGSDDYPLSRYDHIPPEHDRHRDSPAMYELCSHPGIVERTADLYGDDLVLWSSHIWEKEAGGAEIPWHQGDHFHPIEPPVTLTAWVALSEATRENGCLQVVPGSHTENVPHVEADDEKGFHDMADPEQIDESEAVDLELEPGEFVMFNERCLHRSTENETDSPRVGVSVRITVPFVNVRTDSEEMYDDHRTMVLKGEDTLGFNETMEPPVEE